MRAWISPSACSGTLIVPPSKSYTHRAIIGAALAKGHSVIRNVVFSDDVQATVEVLQQLGANIICYSNSVEVDGFGAELRDPQGPLNCRSSGTTLRFLIPLCAMLGRPVSLTGTEQLLARPMGVYEQLFRENGITFRQGIDRITVEGPLAAGEYDLVGNVSSQFISGLLFALPLLQGWSIIHLREEPVSKSYIDMTIDLLGEFGIDIRWENEKTLVIPGNQIYHPVDYRVEGDYSQAAFFAVLAALGGSCELRDLNPDSKQGDRVILSILQQCGATVRPLEDGWSVEQGVLQGFDVSVKDCPDLGPALMVLGMMAKGESTIRDAARLRIKESDRISTMQSECEKISLHFSAEGEEVRLTGGQRSQGGTVCAGEDHRIAMALAIAASLGNGPVVIEGAQSVDKSYPGFFEDLRGVGVSVELLEDQ